MEMLVALFDRPLRQAAVSLGVSNTAMKSICRKLGLPRWPFQETRWQAARVTGKSPCSQTEPPSPRPAKSPRPRKSVGFANSEPTSAKCPSLTETIEKMK